MPGFNAEKRVELSCEEIFTGPVPKLSLSRLAELAKEDIGTEGLAETSIRLPVTRLALAFRFIDGRELIDEPPPPKPVRPERSSEDFAPKDEASKGEELADERVATSPLAAAAPGAETGTNSPAEQMDEREPSSPLAGSLSQTSGGGVEAEESKPGEPETWRPISLFPIFRRKVVEPQVKPPVAPLRPMVESRAPLAVKCRHGLSGPAATRSDEAAFRSSFERLRFASSGSGAC